MDKKNARRRIEGLKTLLIVVLAVTAVLLARHTSLAGPISDLLPGGEETAVGTGIQSIPVDRTGTARPVRMVAAIPGEGRTLRWGVQYDSILCDSLFQRAAGLLVEALSSAGTPIEVPRERWEQLLTTAPGLYFDFLGDIPLPVLAQWLSARDCALTGTARRMVLTAEEGTVLLAFREESSGAYLECSAQAASWEQLRELVLALGDNGARFAFELEEFSALDGDTLVLAEAPNPPCYLGSNPMGGERETMEQLLEELFFPVESTSFYDAGDEQVARNGSETVRLSRRGVAEYSCDFGGSGRYQIYATDGVAVSVSDAAEYCRYLAQKTVGDRCGLARLTLHSVWETARGWEFQFGYCLNGSWVRLDGDSAARFVVQDGQVVQFTLHFRSYAPSGEYGPVLPERQAVAAMEAMEVRGGELQLIYADDGAGSVSPLWVADTGTEG